MASEGSRPRRTPAPSSRAAKYAVIAEAILAPKRKLVKTKAKKVRHREDPIPMQQPSSSDENDTEEAPIRQHQREPTPIDVNELEYTISCTTFFDGKKVWFDVDSCHLREFNVHEYNAKSIKAVTSEAQRIKMGFELVSSVATISGNKLKNCAKSMDDHNDWNTIERLVEKYMKEGFKKIRIDYIVTYAKKRLEHIARYQTPENMGSSDVEQEQSLQSKKRKVSIYLCMSDI